MKKSVLVVACVVAALCGNVALANTPSQDKPVSKTVTTVKKTMPVKATTTTKTVHKKHVKKSD
ncbi:hypothetical protein [Spirosoma agri]|uniref:Acid-shock protein n=1 Tax=Spirosoma agri TaxID=1987381 RepID=A0A6M0IGC3_9BACT|nr:hypothetical protein [Spirosoma agri]NEU67336.1 hypothetical protein [Spirosoma agri]